MSDYKLDSPWAAIAPRSKQGPDPYARIAELEANLGKIRNILFEGYALPAVEHAAECGWASKQSCGCGRTEAAWYTHSMETLDRASGVLAKALGE